MIWRFPQPNQAFRHWRSRGQRWRSRGSWRRVAVLLFGLTVTFCAMKGPGLAQAPSGAGGGAIAQSVVAADVTFDQGRRLYEAGRYREALTALQVAMETFQQQGDRLRSAMTLSNLALVQQQLGQITAAMQAVDQSLALLQTVQTAEQPQILAQTLEVHGGLQLERGQTEAALQTWQKTEMLYRQLDDPTGLVRSRLNQAQALQILGFYRRSLALLTELQPTLQGQPDSLVKVAALRSLGEALQLAGDLERSRQILETSLVLARRLQAPGEISAVLSSLGNTARAQQKGQVAIAYYEEATAIAPTPLSQTQAQINLLTLLVNEGQTTQAQALRSPIQAQLGALPTSQGSIYARISFAQSVMKLDEVGRAIAPELARSLATAAQQAKTLGDIRAESYALGTLGHLYEQAGQWQNSQTVTQQALTLARTLNAADISYRWYWQLGRLKRQQGDIAGAIAAYDNAVGDLQTLRGDLVSVNRDVQFSFRESVEPVYRESVALLLESQGQQPSEPTLDKARQRIEALQLAELDNFFQEACLNERTVLLDKIVDQDNPTAAIIYPIILPDALQVIVKIPKQPLRYHTIRKTQAEVEAVAVKLQQRLVEPDAVSEVRNLSQQVYSWLVAPIASDLQASGVNTLVFVLDGALRSVPMAALYDGKQYLVENYAVSLSLGLQLLNPKPLAEEKLQVLAAGLVQPPPPYEQFPPLPEIKSEFELINQAGVAKRQLLDAAFTSQALANTVNAAPFNVVHLATHGQFSSQAKDTFILAADGPINVTELDSLLRSRGQTQNEAIELLVLSACQTAAGDRRATLGLAGVAVRAGARSTLASLWQISDRSTALFIGEFYQQLAQGNVTKAEALRQAQLTLMREYPNFNRPIYWAPYVLVGNWL